MPHLTTFRSVTALVRWLQGRAFPRVTRVLAIDGPSGAGKTTLAATLAAHTPGRVNVVHLDTVYPGWSGLGRGGTLLERTVVRPLAAGRPGAVIPWNWAAAAPESAEQVRPGGVLIVEGCGAFAALPREFRAIRVWVDARYPERQRRALSRDQGGFDPYWDMWEQQWRRYRAQTRADRAADAVFRWPEVSPPRAATPTAS